MSNVSTQRILLIGTRTQVLSPEALQTTKNPLFRHSRRPNRPETDRIANLSCLSHSIHAPTPHTGNSCPPRSHRRSAHGKELQPRGAPRAAQTTGPRPDIARELRLETELHTVSSKFQASGDGRSAQVPRHRADAGSNSRIDVKGVYEQRCYENRPRRTRTANCPAAPLPL